MRSSQNIGDKLRNEIRELLSNQSFQKCTNVDMMTDMLMKKLADIAEQEEQSQILSAED